jgi:hypothetical protein
MDEVSIPKLSEVIGHEILRQFELLNQILHTLVRTGKTREDIPAYRMTSQFEDLWRMGKHRRFHTLSPSLSNQIATN